MAERFLAALTARRFLTALGLAAMLAALPVDGFAQDQPNPNQPNSSKRKLPEAPAKLPKVPTDRAKGLDFLFGALKAAPDEDSAKAVEARIWAIWLQTSSDTAALLMLRAKAAMEGQQPELAIKLLDAVIKLRPDYVEAWNRRATLYYLRNDYTRSLADIQQVLVREPRHFAALAGLGMIMQDLGDDKRALEAFRKALAINPHLEKVPELVKQLTEKVEGRDI
ncbi:tetratricopeptide repeat protein [Bradyrhizobium sp. Tv2a-2]|uniref:tetratricopeptide repeat protein n=1 Tax=Bradyrhizobium sp. Tv2a-2 TaxID=113395 RepID=UPI0004216A0F|nr:tetratricopeptide repeat protein [Bradyrhizobium sp. Tv2a-2]